MIDGSEKRNLNFRIRMFLNSQRQLFRASAKKQSTCFGSKLSSIEELIVSCICGTRIRHFLSIKWLKSAISVVFENTYQNDRITDELIFSIAL